MDKYSTFLAILIVLVLIFMFMIFVDSYYQESLISETHPKVQKPDIIPGDGNVVLDWDDHSDMRRAYFNGERKSNINDNVEQKII